jgi:hypothetical protein
MKFSKSTPPEIRRVSLEVGLTLVHISAQLQRFLWDRGCIQ